MVARMSETYNGPAFPVNELHQQAGDVCVQHFGLTLRDYFAAKAMQSVLIGATVVGEDAIPKLAAQLGQIAYVIADAMLKARLA